VKSTETNLEKKVTFKSEVEHSQSIADTAAYLADLE
jgi:hypothetical protein